MQRVYQNEYEGTNEDVTLNDENNNNHNITFIISNSSDGNDNVINESPRESVIRTTSSMYNPVEFLEYLASQEQYSPNISDVNDTNHYNNANTSSNNNNKMIKTPNQKSSSEPPLTSIYSDLNKRSFSSPLHLSPLEEVQNQIVGLRNSRTHSILLDYPNNNTIINSNIASRSNNNNNNNIYNNSNLINQHQNNFILTEDINNNINISNNDYNNNYYPQPQHIKSNNNNQPNTIENSNLKLSNMTLTRNTSRISSPKFESPPDVISAYTAQIQSSETPLMLRDNNNINNNNNIISSRGVYNNNVINNNNVVSNINNSSNNISSNNGNGNNINNNGDTKPIFFGKNNEPHSPISPVSRSTDQQPLIPSKKSKHYKVKSGAFIMCLEIFVLGVIVIVSWKITDLAGGNKALFNITTGVIPIIHNKTTTTNIQHPT